MSGDYVDLTYHLSLFLLSISDQNKDKYTTSCLLHFTFQRVITADGSQSDVATTEIIPN